MHHWDRNTADILERSNAPQEEDCEVRIHSGQMELPPEEQLNTHLSDNYSRI